MNEGGKSAVFHEFFTKGQYETQTEMLAVDGDKKGVSIGIPREVLNSEHRVSLVPHSIRTLIGYISYDTSVPLIYSDLFFSTVS